MKPLRFDDLPENAQAALDEFHSGEIPPSSWRYGFARVPLRLLVGELVRLNIDVRDYGGFDRYHREYKKWATASEEWPPQWTKHDPNSIWPIILQGPPGGPYFDWAVIEDGWHRFHWYIDKYGPQKLIPVVWPVPPKPMMDKLKPSLIRTRAEAERRG